MILIVLGILSDEEKDLINAIYKDSNALLYSISLSMLKSPSDAEDAVAQAYIKMMKHIEKISSLPCPQIVPYCVMIVKNTAIDMLNKRKPMVRFDDFDALEDLSNTDEIWKNIEAYELHEVMEHLSQESRYILELHYGNGLGYREIAVLLEISEETAKKRGQRARKQLRELLEEGTNCVGGI